MRRILISLFLVFTAVAAFSEPVQVMLEPMPPLINEDGTGMTVDMLKAVASSAGVTLTIKIATYARAKAELMSGNIQLMGHTPYGQEEKAFYAYAQELEWSIDTFADIYALKAENVEKAKWNSLKIGCPRGNKEFFASISGVPETAFFEEELGALVKMLSAGRIDAIMFERSSTMSTIAKLGIKNLYYNTITKIPAGLAVAKTPAGTDLMKRLDAAIKKYNTKSIFSAFTVYAGLPEKGIVK